MLGNVTKIAPRRDGLADSLTHNLMQSMVQTSRALILLQEHELGP
jgi:hypothetical protein